MSFQLFGGRRIPQSALDDSEQIMAVDSAQAPSSIFCVERVCAAFLTAHNAIIALSKDCDDLNVLELSDLRERRYKAFRQVRMQSARTKSAYKAKMRVLIVMRDWFSIENPEVSAFAIEMALEAAALIDSDLGQECAYMTREETFEQQSRGAERRNRLAWFTRPPFAN